MKQLKQIIAVESAKEFFKRSLPAIGVIAKAAGLEPFVPEDVVERYVRYIKPAGQTDAWRISVTLPDPGDFTATEVYVGVRGVHNDAPRLWLKRVPVDRLEAELAMLIDLATNKLHPQTAYLWLGEQGYR